MLNGKAVANARRCCILAFGIARRLGIGKALKHDLQPFNCTFVRTV